jgi:RNA polymerase sigma-70 factor (ECF subfamily)
MNAEIGDGDLVLLARAGDTVAFRLLFERHQPMARARARGLCANPSDVDDVVQESFLRAFIGLERLRDPDRFAGWLGNITANVCRGLRRHAPVTLLPDWPEPLHPAAAHGLPSADDLDRADALRAAVADLPAGQRRAVALHYYADLPPGQIGESAGAARASLHKARLKLRAYLTEYRPDLVPVASRRTAMTTVRIAHVERRIPPGPLPIGFPSHVIMLADDVGRRELPIWAQDFDPRRLSQFLEPPAAGHEDAMTAEARTVDELTARLLRAAGVSVTGVDIDELGPELAVARITLATPTGPRHVTARVAEGLAVAITARAPVRVADQVMDRLALPLPDDDRPVPLPEPAAALAVLSPHGRPRYEPRNLTFADGLDGWLLGGSFTGHASHSHWQDYSSAAEDGFAVLSSAVPRPAGFAFLGQEVFADDYRGDTVTFRGKFRVRDTTRTDTATRTGLFLRVVRGPDVRQPLTERAAMDDPDNTIVTVSGDRDWTSHEVTAQVPGDANSIVFGTFLAGSGRIELRNPELIRPLSRLSRRCRRLLAGAVNPAQPSIKTVR